MSLAGNELFICDRQDSKIAVLSFSEGWYSGPAHHFTIEDGNQWYWPENLCCVSDRLYLAEQRHEDEGLDPLCGRRIFVMTLRGEILQVYAPPNLEDGWEFCEGSMLIFGRKLLLRTMNPSSGHSQLIALQGI
eukprot:3042501-Prymnesium_polylepis.1